MSDPLPYLRVVNDLRRKIESGELGPGAPLPSNKALMDEFGISTSTAQRAVRALKSDGLVETVLGKGVYVRHTRRKIRRSASYLAVPSTAQDAALLGVSTNVQVREVEPPDDVAEALGLESGARAVRRERTIVLDDEPVQLVTSYYPVELARGTSLAKRAPLRGGSMAELSRLGVDAHHCVEDVQTRMPTGDEARALKMGPGTPVFRVLRTVLTRDDRPVEVLDMILGGDRYQLRYELPIHD